jgi:hypothetical protein
LNIKCKRVNIPGTIMVLFLTLAVFFLPYIQAACQNVQDQRNSEFLTSILGTANISINQTISNLKAENVTIQQSVIAMLSEIEAGYNQVVNLNNQNKFAEASTFALQTLQKVKVALTILNSLGDQTQTTREDTLRLTIQNAIDRNCKVLERLANMATMASGTGIKIDEIAIKLTTIENMLKSAKTNLDQKEYEQAKNEVAKAQTIIDEVTPYFGNLANTINAQRVSTYITNAQQNLASIKQQIASPTSNLNSSTIAVATTTIAQAEISLEKAQQFLDNQQITQTIDELSTVQTSQQTLSNIISASQTATVPTAQSSSSPTPTPNDSNSNPTSNTSSTTK